MHTNVILTNRRRIHTECEMSCLWLAEIWSKPITVHTRVIHCGITGTKPPHAVTETVFSIHIG